MFLGKTEYWDSGIWVPPDDSMQWSEACQAFEDLHGLRSLRMEIFIQTPVKEDSFVHILAPLNRITASLFEIEMKMTIPPSVQEILGPFNFTTEAKQRPRRIGLEELWA
jgi:hypothetical protein